MSNKFETLSEIEIAKIGQLVDTLDKSSFDFLSLELAEFKLTVGKGDILPEVVAGALGAPAPVAAPATSHTVALAASAASSEAASPAESAAASPAALVEEGLIDVVATTMGRFYSRPEPNAPPFVTVGAVVDIDTTVGLIEVMKLFNGVTAGVAGTVAQLCVEDAQLVEFGQVLMRVRSSE